MNRDQLAHVLRAATRITGDGDIVVLGSQSILGTYSDTELPAAATMSVEADLAWRNERIQVCSARAGTSPPAN